MYRLFDTYGEYVPGFFKISLNKDLFKGIKWTDFDDEEKATFVHEYIHYLQDITTTRGINNFIYVSKILQLNFADAAKRDLIELPINIENVADKQAYIESELQSFYQGNSEHKKIHHINRICREREELMDKLLENESSVFSIDIYYDDKDTPYMVGNAAIAESMAYIIEKFVFNGLERKNEFPYNICELICENNCKWLLQRPGILAAACELSLMHYHSGDMFLHIIQEIAKEKLLFESIDEFEKYFFEKTEFLFSNMKEEVEKVQGCLDFLYPLNVPNLEKINAKVRKILLQGYEYRDKHKIFISRMLEENNPIQILLKWIQKFGIPIIVDRNKEIYAGEELALMIGPFAMYNFFMSRSENGCCLVDLCLVQNMSVYNSEQCNNEPWKQAENDKLCIFGMYWYMYSLSGKKVKR